METMPTLADIQTWLSARILDHPGEPATRIDRWITPACAEHTRERLNVYVHGYPARLDEALREAFPALAHVIGDKDMHGLVRRFALKARLRSYNLNDAGAELPAFLRSDPLAQRLPFLPDLAELEWRVLRAFHAADESPFDPAPMASSGGDAWSRAVLQFQPSFSIVSSAWPIHEIWRLRETPLEEIDIALEGNAEHVLVRRSALDVVCEAIDAEQARALNLLHAGLRLGIVLETLSSAVAPESINAWFRRWVEIGIIRAVVVAG